MILDRVEITNFRSIEDGRIAFSPSCRGLVGLNESGKSSLLRALSLLDPSVKVVAEDVRDCAPDENPIETAEVNFIFQLEDTEISEVVKQMSPKLLMSKPGASISLAGRPLDLRDFVKARREVVHWVDLVAKQRHSGAFSLPEDAKLIGEWLKPKVGAIGTLEIPGISAALSAVGLVQKALVPPSLHSMFQEATAQDVNDLFDGVVKVHIDKHLPKCVYWRYSDDQLLPAKTSLSQFVSSPKSCPSLLHLFALAGHRDPSKSINDLQQKPNGLRNLLQRVATVATEHFCEVWKDYADVSFSITMNGDSIETTIKDTHNYFDLSRRSDGFRRFVAFLLMISTQVKTKSLSKFLLLCDEPDVGLHPSAVRHLRDELLRIGSANYVVYSTHSIFMIDNKTPGRHIIVTKDEERTALAEVTSSNIIDEEVVFNALGFSLREILPGTGLIFEGWRDKHLFNVAVLASGHAIDFRDVGRCHARGVKDVEHLSSILDLAARSFLVISDSDQIAVEHQRTYKGPGRWLRYDELARSVTAVTAEDFLAPDRIIDVVKTWSSTKTGLASVPIADLRGSKPRMQVVKAWLATGGLKGEALRIALDELKDAFFDGLHSDEILPAYGDVIKGILDRISKEAPIVQIPARSAAAKSRGVRGVK
jgi:hypothetical protein